MLTRSDNSMRSNPVVQQLWVESCTYAKIVVNIIKDTTVVGTEIVLLVSVPKQIQWMDRRMDELLPVQYFHSVFTIPDELNEWFINYPRQMYKLLFDASWYTIETLGWDHKYLGAQMGAIGILHTWGQNLSLHPHIHYIVPGGGVDIRNKWRTIKSKGKYLFPVKVIMMVFRARLFKPWKEWVATEGMEIAPETITALKSKSWVVYCKPPFGGSKGALEYIRRYVFKTRHQQSSHPISDRRESHVSLQRLPKWRTQENNEAQQNRIHSKILPSSLAQKDGAHPALWNFVGTQQNENSSIYPSLIRPKTMSHIGKKKVWIYCCVNNAKKEN